MRHFSFLSKSQTSKLFHRAPQPLDIDSSPALLAAGLGATLYCPGNRPNIAADVRKQATRGCLSMVLCLEDSIADQEVPEAEVNVAKALRQLQKAKQDGDVPSAGLPLIFIRVRTPEQMLRLADLGGAGLAVLSGFVVPKFDNTNGYADSFLDALHRIQNEHGLDGANGGRRLSIMPILESPVMIHSETRHNALADIHQVLRANRSDILAVRIGATDLSSGYGLRRSRDLTVYDVKVVAAVIADIVNVVGRREDNFVITGPVWEHYDNTERLLRPQLRLTPFVEAKEKKLRQRLLMSNLDGLMREISLDQANGLLGKTVIHPTHVKLVHAMSVVSHEEFVDAQAIIGDVTGGANASPYRNKMNEMKPHQTWAQKTLLRADAFGVSSEDTTFVDLLEASLR
ncbi:MAG: ATP/GTP-binding protein [Glaciihabitans sp.]|nr:ATP/GTP-binding protein [Glaciihabitans sp.]